MAWMSALTGSDTETFTDGFTVGSAIEDSLKVFAAAPGLRTPGGRWFEPGEVPAQQLPEFGLFIVPIKELVPSHGGSLRKKQD